MMDLLNDDTRCLFCTKTIIPLMVKIAKEAISDNYTVEKKGQGNFVTDVDKIIEEKLKRNLSIILPNAGFIAEESSIEEGEGDFRWIIDSIDGTTNYIYGLPYTISLALEYKPKKEILLGVVLVPKDNLIYYACKNKGSYLIENEKTKRLHVGSFPQNEGLAIFGLPYNRAKTNKIFEIAKRYYEISSDLKRIGPSSLDICLVASGKAKVYFELDLNVWDVAAGILILTEAGGSYGIDGDLMIFYGNDC